MYKVQQELWVDFATMHFAGNAALWLQTYEAMHTIDSWAALCVAVFAKFNRNKYTRAIDVFFALKQTDCQVTLLQSKFLGLKLDQRYPDCLLVCGPEKIEYVHNVNPNW